MHTACLTATPHAPSPPRPTQVSVLETARVQAIMWEGGSEDQLFYGAAGQFVEKLAAVRSTLLVLSLGAAPLALCLVRPAGMQSRSPSHHRTRPNRQGSSAAPQRPPTPCCHLCRLPRPQEISKLGGRIETSSPARHIAQSNASVDVYSDSGVYGAK